MTEPELTAVPMDEHDREHLAVLLRDAGSLDLAWLHGLIARYDIARSIKGALSARPERVAGVFACNPDEAYAADDPKHETFHDRHSLRWDLFREGK